MIYKTLDELFDGICNAIREKDGTTALISHQDIPDRIKSISVGVCGGGGINLNLNTGGSSNGVKISSDLIASNFSAGALYLEKPFMPGDNPWEMQIKLVWPTNVTRENQVFGNYGKGHRYAPIIVVGKSSSLPKRFFFGVPDGIKFDVWNHFLRVDIDVTEGETYWFRVGFDGDNTYYARMSNDGKIYETIGEFNYGAMYQDESSLLSLGQGYGGNGYSFTGSIDLKETWIKVNGEFWFG